MNSIRDTLKGLDLSDKEIDIYLALLTVGSAPASVLGQRTNITRSTAQYTCQQLARKGIVKSIQKANVFLYTPEPPEKLILLLEKQKQDIDRKEDDVQRIIGELKGMMNPQAQFPKVQFYQGEEGLIELYERILDTRQPIDSFEEAGELFTLFPDYPTEFVAKRIQHKMFNRCIAPVGNPLNVTDPKKFIETRVLDPQKFPFTWHVKICGNLVGIFSFQKQSPVAIAIDHEDITKNFRLLFEFVWLTLGV